MRSQYAADPVELIARIAIEKRAVLLRVHRRWFPALGWWTQWLRIAAGWWLAFHERHELLSLVRAGDTMPSARRERSQRMFSTMRERTMRRAADGLIATPGRWGRRVLSPPPRAERRHSRPQRERGAHARVLADKQVLATLDRDLRDARMRVEGAPAAQAAISEKRAQLRRVELARQKIEENLERESDHDGPTATAASRRLVQLDGRAQRLEAQIGREQAALVSARKLVAEGQRADGRAASDFGEERVRRRARFYDEQAALPEKGRRDRAGRRRDYSALAPLAGRGGDEWDELGADQRRRATLAIDGALASRARMRRDESDGSGTVGNPIDHDDGSGRERLAHATLGASSRVERSRDRPTSPLSDWLEEERKVAAASRRPHTLAERARAEPSNPIAEEHASSHEQLRRLRRQFGRRGRGEDDD